MEKKHSVGRKFASSSTRRKLWILVRERRMRWSISNVKNVFLMKHVDIQKGHNSPHDFQHSPFANVGGFYYGLIFHFGVTMCGGGDVIRWGIIWLGRMWKWLETSEKSNHQYFRGSLVGKRNTVDISLAWRLKRTRWSGMKIIILQGKPYSPREWDRSTQLIRTRIEHGVL